MDNKINYTLRIIKLHCYMSDESDADEVFLKFNGKKIWPEEKFIKMKDADEKVSFELKVEKGSRNVVEVWDYDFWSPNDKLGEVTLVADKMGGPFTSDFTKTDKGNSRYALVWEVM